MYWVKCRGYSVRRKIFMFIIYPTVFIPRKRMQTAGSRSFLARFLAITFRNVAGNSSRDIARAFR